jgi:hypothetical protein
MLGWLAFVHINVVVAVFWIPASDALLALGRFPMFSPFHHHLVPASPYLVPLVIMVAVIYIYVSNWQGGMGSVRAECGVLLDWRYCYKLFNCLSLLLRLFGTPLYCNAISPPPGLTPSLVV